MQITNIGKFTSICVIAAFSIGGLVACHSNDYVSSDSKGSGSDTIDRNTSAVTSDHGVARDTATSDEAKYAAANTGKAINTNANEAGTSTVPTADNAKTVRKKRMASVTMPAGNNDRMANGTMMVKDKEGVYNNVQVMPEFPGGQNALANYVNQQVEYPQQAIDDNTTGTVKVSFVVDEQGKVSHARLLNGQNNKLGHGLDEAALRVVNNMPTWKPGKVKGKNVKTRLELPITFQFES